MSFLGELRRRNVVKAGIAYAIVAWLLIQFASIVLPTFGAPRWALQTLTFVLLLGFPVALVLAWAYELTPEGIKPTKRVPRAESIRHLTGQKLNYIVILLLALAVVFLVVDNYVLDGPDPPVAQDTSTDIDQQPLMELLPNSVAVLPFENMSPDPEDAFFAAGIHEEILNQLTKISALTVIARTTMMRYKDTDRGIPEIAEELRVVAVMEGSVRYAGDRVRVTAQLIDPGSGGHLWSETYDGDQSDIFAFQTNIATQVALALEAELLPSEKESINTRPTDSPEAYALYLKANDAGLANDIQTYRRFLDQAIAVDPDFALAYAQRARINAFGLIAVRFRPESALSQGEIENRARADARRALELDPNLSAAYAARAVLNVFLWRLVEARRHFQRAFDAKPNDFFTLLQYGQYGHALGDTEGAIRRARHAVELDPGNFFAHMSLAQAMVYANNFDAAAAALRDAIRLNPTSSDAIVFLAAMDVVRGNAVEAEAALRLAEGLDRNRELSAYDLANRARVYGVLGLRDDAKRYFREIEEWALEHPTGPGDWARAYLAIGDRDRALDWLNTAAKEIEAEEAIIGWFSLIIIATNSIADPVLEEPEFAEVRNRMLRGRSAVQ